MPTPRSRWQTCPSSKGERSLATATTVSYYAALGAQRQVEVRQRALEVARHHQRLAHARVELGDAFEVEALRAETAVATQEQALLQVQNAERLAVLALQVLIGDIDAKATNASDEVPVVTLRRPLAASSASDRDPGSTLEHAIASRLDLKQRRLQVSMASNVRGEAWTRFLPALVASGIYSWSNVEGFTGDNVNWNLSLALRWTVFEGGRSYWTLQQTEYDLNAAVLMVDKTRQDIARQVREAELNLESARAGLAIAAKRVALARKTGEMIRAQYEVGLATQLDLLDADRMLADSETAEGLAQFQVDVGLVAIEQAVYAAPLGTM